jgi:serine/threonine-protein kinase
VGSQNDTNPPRGPEDSDHKETLDAPTQLLEESGAEGHVLLRAIDALDPTLERYALTRLHSKGGLGQVWVARDRSLEREVAFKEIRPERGENPSVWARFVREARITGLLEHPGIVPIYELSRRRDTGRPFYTMRFVRGRTLGEAIAAYHATRQSGAVAALDLQALLNALIGVANAIAFAHAKGVIHRDLKPDNVILGDFGEVILLDWGLAKVLGAESPDAGIDAVGVDAAVPDLGRIGGASLESGGTVEGQILGTPAYMSPEQAAGRLDAVGPASDIYGLGAILHEILTGKPPVDGTDTTDVLRRAAHEARPRARTLRPDTPAPLDAICARALALQPQDRYASARAFADDLRRFLADEPVSAWREPFSRRAARWAKRHRTLVSSLSVLVIVALVGVSIGAVLLGRKNREIETERARAEENFRLAKGAVDRYLTEVADSGELKAKGLEGLRTNLLGSARDFYTRFVAMRQGDEAAVGDLAAAHLNLGNISRETGDAKQAEASLREARTLYETRFRREPGVTSARTDLIAASGNLALVLSESGRPKDAAEEFGQAVRLIEEAPPLARDDEPFLSGAANIYDNLGVLDNAQHRPEESEAAHRKGLALRERLVTLRPAREDYQSALLKSELNLATLYDTTGREREALPHLERAAAIGETLFAAHPENTDFANDLGATYNNLGGTYTLTGRLDDARRAHARALAIRETLAADHPALIEPQISLAGSYVNLGELETRAARDAAALPYLDKAQATLDGILVKTPGHEVARFYMAYALSWRARALGGLGRTGEAMTTWERATSFNDRNYPTIPAGYAVALARAGRTAQATALAAKVETIPALPGEVLYDLAATWSLSAARGGPRRETDAARAIALLRRAAAAGLFKNPGMTEHAAADHDLDAVRDRTDYRAAIDG